MLNLRRPTTALVQLSDAITTLVATAAPMLVAIRIGPNRHVSVIVRQQNLVVTADRGRRRTTTRSRCQVALWPERRNAASNLVALRLTAAVDPVQILPTLALALGADAGAVAMARMTVIHAISNAGADRTLTLDLVDFDRLIGASLGLPLKRIGPLKELESTV